MATCMISEKDTVVFQYVRFTEAPKQGEGQRVLFCRFDHLARAQEGLPEDFREPMTLRWNPGPMSDSLGLDEHRRLSDDPRLRKLPDMVRATIPRSKLRAKLSQFIQARERLMNP